jgi:spore germination protein PE
MLKRTSKVDFLKVNSGALSSVIQIGDSSVINCLTNAIAVQRQRELFFGNEGNFAAYDIFNISLLPSPIEEQINIRSTSLNPLIKVGSIRLIAISSASVLHIGSTEHVQGESRIKHIRHLEYAENTGSNTS